MYIYTEHYICMSGKDQHDRSYRQIGKINYISLEE